MIEERELLKCAIFQEMGTDDRNFWFDFKKCKFLHNIDTFYYSAKFEEDFTLDTAEKTVLDLRSFFKKKYELLDNDVTKDFLPLCFDGKDLNLRRFSFAGMYNVCLQYPDWFDIFIAPVVPRGGDGGLSSTCEIVVQLRSYMLWAYGVNEAFERSYEYVQTIADYFGLTISFCQENRIDYCWHSNYIQNPDKFFREDNFYKMRVDYLKDTNTHTVKKGSEGYELDYIAVGKRSDKVFLRIYLKSKEVVEMGYKGWFFYFWLFHGLINRYDLYVYEECYKRRNWRYMNMARVSYYLEFGTNEYHLGICKKLLDGTQTMEEDVLQRFVDELTPSVHLIMNVEYQTKRRHSKTYELLPLRDNSDKKAAKRIFDYLDNRKLIMDYLTMYVFRLVESSGDVNKSRRDLCGFWKSLRSCKLVDVHLPPKHLKLMRNYSSDLNAQLVKTRAVNSIVTYGFYKKGINGDNIVKDMLDILCTMNDNDLEKAVRYKTKKARQLNSTELPGVEESSDPFRFDVIDRDTGEIYHYDSMIISGNQGGDA